MSFFEDKNISSLALVNPDNPSGNYIQKEDILLIAKWSKDKCIRLIVDESFVDFADTKDSASLLDNAVLQKYPELIVVKSISKSFGVPGLRLGVLVSNDLELIGMLKKDVAIWNINSFAEFYLQIFEKYQSDYKKALDKFKKVRQEYIEKLSAIPGLRVIPTQANFVMCEVLGSCTSKKLTETLLNEYDILIKDLSSKKGFDGQYIRMAVKRPEENEKLINALKMIFK